MTISIDWPTGTITVPKVDMTLIQENPVEIRELNLNVFRLALKDLEDNPDGMPFTKTHTHNTEVTLGGLIYARVIEILEPYTVTFEDGQYAVNLTGANSNVGDRVNVNNVSVRSANSAGLISTSAVEYASFNGGVTIDAINGTEGTAYPLGTPNQPVSTVESALLIAEYRGLIRLFINGDITFTTGDDITEYIVEGQSVNKTKITIDSGAVCNDCEFENATVTGVLDGGSQLRNCIAGDLAYVNGEMFDCGLYGTIALNGGAQATFADCNAITVSDLPVIDMGGSGQDCIMTDWSGSITFKNLTSETNKIAVQIDGGAVTLDSTITAGVIAVNGIGILNDNATSYTLLQQDGLLNKANISTAVGEEIGTEIQFAAFNNRIEINVDDGVSGTAYPIGTTAAPVNNLTDAKAIAATRGFTHFYLTSALTIATGEDITGLTFESENWMELTIETGVTSDDAVFTRLSIQEAEFNGYWNILVDCWTYSATNFCGWVRKGSFEEISLAEYTVDSAGESFFDDVVPMAGGVTSTLTMNTNVVVSFTNCKDICTIKSLTAGSTFNEAMIGGILIVDSTCTGGDIVVTGTGQLTNNSALIIDDTGLVNQETVAIAVWDESIADHLIAGSTGLSVGIGQFDGVVTISTAGTAGTTFPLGTARVPVDNIADAVTIAATRGISTLKFTSDFTIASTVSIASYDIVGEGQQATTLTCEDGAVLAYCHIKDCSFTGNVIGVIGFTDCLMTSVGAVTPTLSTITAIMTRCIMKGVIVMSANFEGKLYALDCVGMPTDAGEPPILDMNGGAFDVELRNYSGFFMVKNCDDAVDIRVMFNAGGITLASTVTAGNFIFSGVGTLEDNSTSVDSLDVTSLVNETNTATAVWDQEIGDHLLPNTTGHQMYHQAYEGVVRVDVINGSAGTTFPTGTSHDPCDNLSDALTIAHTHFINTIHIAGDFTMDGEDITGLIIAADRSLGNSITITSMVNTDSCYFENITVSGALSGSTRFTECVLGTLTGFDGGAKNCLLRTDIEITGTGANYFTDCDTYVTSTDYVSLDVGDKLLNIIRGRGSWEIDNFTGTNIMALDFSTANVHLTSSCVSGTIIVAGQVDLYDDSAAGCTVFDASINESGIADAVWSEDLSTYTTDGTAGNEMLALIASQEHKAIVHDNGDDTQTITVYEKNGVDIYKQYTVAVVGADEIRTPI